MKSTKFMLAATLLITGTAFVWKALHAEARTVASEEARGVLGELDPLIITHGPLFQSITDYTCASTSSLVQCNKLSANNYCDGVCGHTNQWKYASCVVRADATCSFCRLTTDGIFYECVQSTSAYCFEVPPVTVYCGPKTRGTQCSSFALAACTTMQGLGCLKKCKDSGSQIGTCNNLASTCQQP